MNPYEPPQPPDKTTWSLWLFEFTSAFQGTFLGVVVGNAVFLTLLKSMGFTLWSLLGL
jgi:hypothetical protein